ncbi:uncharacterized protein [Lolium perenne]|uniref:uncharacterized protein isoform X2 n=1 Tax=Lolium perenne TaxID=4522 RepID=UPI0021F511C5|nr:uncharacterized protein LOC127319673 isoform X2 [Lolium perenne]
MSSGQQPRKRLTSSSLPPDHHRSRQKRPKLVDQSSLLSLNPHVRLWWDGASRRVIPAEDQIGIPWSRLAPFVDGPPRRRASRLADVLSVPKDVFLLENLRRVLSYEVWDKYLTEADMKFLAQFLPTGTNTEETVHSLLTGKNHHFGNPLLSWSSALCYGHLHPDALLSKERQIRADKKACGEQLNEYHSDMTETLTKWKDKWLTCENPEILFRDNPAKQKKRDHGENVLSSKALNNAMPLKVVRNGDVTKFMSYIKITKSQHELVKRMKQSGDGIQTKQLSSVIGDIDNFHVKPYETLMEDEKNKLHAYWAILSRQELPAAVEARRERKSMAQNLMTSLCLELAVEEAEQVADRTAYQNGGISDEQEEPVDRTPEDVAQPGHNSSAVPGDEDDNDTSDTDTSSDSHDSTDQDVNGTSDTGTSTDSHDSPNSSDQDAMGTNNTNITTQSQSSADEQDQEFEKTSGMNTSAKSGNSSARQDEDMEDTSCKDFNPGAEDDDIEDTSCKDTSLEDHNIPDMQEQETKPMNHTISPIEGLNSASMLVQDCTNTGYVGFPIHSNGGLDEQTDDLKNMCYPSASAGHENKIEMNHMGLAQRETARTTVMSSDCTLLFSKPFSKQNNAEEGPELNGPAKYQDVLWQSVSPVDSFYRPPGNNMYVQSRALQLEHHPSTEPATSIIDARQRQQAQIAVTTALPMCNPASLLPPFTNQLTSEQLLNSVNGIGMTPSYSLGHMNGTKQSVNLHSMTNRHVAQSGLVQEPMQLLDVRHNGLYSQQVENNMYPGPVLCTQNTIPMVEQQKFAGHAPLDRSGSWFPNEQQPLHNNNNNTWSGMESNDIVLGQDLPSQDGSLSSVLSQYKQVSSHVSNSEQFIGRRNLVPPHGLSGNLAVPSPDGYVYTQNNMASSLPVPRSQADVSLQWAQGGHRNGMASFKQFGGDPWSR